MEIFFSEEQLKYNPKQEFGGKEFRPYPEKPDRIDWIKSALVKYNNDVIELIYPKICDVDKIKQVHDDGYVDFIQSLPENIDEQAPMTLAPPNIQIQPTKDSTFEQQFGYYFFSVDTPVTPETFISSHHSVSSALECLDSIMGNSNIAIGLSRPPGHHAMHSKGGGYCFFNNIAIAAQEAVNRGKTVSILDLDYHHGNGTQDLFFDTSKVQYVSIHAEDAYPYYWGHSDEIGEGDGKNFNFNYPISNTTNSDRYDVVLTNAISEIEDYNPDLLLVSMGFDAYHKDPIAGMELTKDYYKTIGLRISNFSKLGIILEGGYSEDIGECFVNLTQGLI
ncbi:MAG: histone deacetylase family protein [Candidatus Kariarchaeaceae archaeon]